MEEVKMYEPHENQETIHEAINGGTEKYYTLNIGRQFGKSMLAQNQAVDWLCNKGWHGAWVAPTFRQSKKVSEELYNAYEGLFEYNRSDLILQTENGGQLQFFSAERYDNIRGFTFDFLIMDEAAFIDEAAWTKVLRATVLVRGKKVLFVSTPNGKNWFYNTYMMDGVHESYKSFKFTSYDNPKIDASEIDTARDTLPDHIFRQEYLAEFLDGGTSLFKNMPYKEPQQGTKYFAGVDVGRADDYTVLTILNEYGEMVFIDRWRHDLWENIRNKVADKINEYNAATLVEVNSIGDPFLEDLQKKVKQAEAFTTSNKSKREILESLMVAADNNETSCLEVDWIKKELDVFAWEYNPKTRVIKYGAPVGFHDDGVMSFAIAYHSYKNLRHSGKYFIR